MRVSFDRSIEKYHAYMLRRMFSSNTIKNRLAFFEILGKWLSQNHENSFQDLRAVTCDIIDEFIDYLVLKGLESSTIRIYQSDLKLLFVFLYKSDLLSSDPTRKIVNPRVPKKEIDYIRHDVVLKTLDEMFDKPGKGDDYLTALRNYHIIRVAYVTGWRASESLACDPSKDIDWETGEIYIPSAKGGGDCYVFMDPETTRKLKDWFYSRYPNGKKLWYSMKGVNKGKPLTYIGYLRVFKKYFNKGSHRLRASFATHLFEGDVDIKVIQELMRHESISSTMRYISTSKLKIKGIHARKNPFSS